MTSYNESGQIVISLPVSKIELTLENPDNLKGDHLRKTFTVAQEYGDTNTFTTMMALVSACAVKVIKPTDTNTDALPDLSQPLTIKEVEANIKSANISKISLRQLMELPIKDSLYLMEVVSKDYSFLGTMV